MRRVYKIIACMLLISYVNVLAETCPPSEINRLEKLANNIKINYEVIEEKKTIEIPANDNQSNQDYKNTITIYKIKSVLYNLDKDLYLKQTNNKTPDINTIDFSKTDNGKYVIGTEDSLNYTTYEFEVYSNIDSCSSTLIKRIKYIKPKLNDNYFHPICIANPTVPVCQQFITEDTGVKDASLIKYVENYVKNQTVKSTSLVVNERKSEKENIFSEYKGYILIGAAVVITGIIILKVISRKRSSI